MAIKNRMAMIKNMNWWKRTRNTSITANYSLFSPTLRWSRVDTTAVGNGR